MDKILINIHKYTSRLKIIKKMTKYYWLMNKLKQSVTSLP